MEEALSNHVILAGVVKYLSTKDAKSVRLLNNTWNSVVLLATPPKLCLNLGKVIHSSQNDCELCSFDTRLARYVSMGKKQSPDNEFLYNFGDNLEALSIVSRDRPILPFFDPLFTGKLKQLETLEIQHTGGFPTCDLLHFFDPQLFPFLRVLRLGDDANGLLEQMKSGGLLHSGITSLELPHWVKVSNIEGIRRILPNLNSLEIGPVGKCTPLMDAIHAEFLNGTREVMLQHLHIHVPFEETDWSYLMEMILDRKDALELKTLTFEAHPDRSHRLMMRCGLSTLEIKEIQKAFSKADEIKFVNFVWDELTNVGPDEPEALAVARPRVTFGIKVPYPLQLTVLSCSKFKTHVMFTEELLNQLSLKNRFHYLLSGGRQ